MRLNFFKKAITLCSFTSMAFFSAESAEGLLASIKSIGMAATATSFPLDSLSIAYNPSGIAFLQDRVDLGGACDHTPQRAEIKGNLSPIAGINRSYNASRVINLFGGEGGAVKQIGCNMSLGLAVYNRDFNKTTYTRSIPLLGTTRLSGEYLHEVAALSWALRVLPCVSIGASLNYHLQRIKLNGLQSLDNATFSSDPGKVTNKNYNYSQGVGGGVGILWKATSWLSLGVSYQHKVRMTRFKKYKGFVAERGRLDCPQCVIAGISFKPWTSLTVAFDYQLTDWDQIKSLHNPLLPNAFSSKLGRSTGAGFGVRSQNFYRVGVNWHCKQWLSLRAGYRHSNSIIPDGQTAINVLSCDTAKDFITCGATLFLKCNNEISFLYAHGFKHTVHGKNSVPSQLGGGEVSISQQKNIFGLTIAHIF